MNGRTIPHAGYPHFGNGDLYDCPACEVIMAEEDAHSGDNEYDGPATVGVHSITNTESYRVSLSKHPDDNPWLTPGTTYDPPF